MTRASLDTIGMPKMDEAHSPIQIRRAITSGASEIASVLYESFVEYEPLYTV